MRGLIALAVVLASVGLVIAQFALKVWLAATVVANHGGFEHTPLLWFAGIALAWAIVTAFATLTIKLMSVAGAALAKVWR